jgi:hypothetical protein
VAEARFNALAQAMGVDRGGQDQGRADRAALAGCGRWRRLRPANPRLPDEGTSCACPAISCPFSRKRPSEAQIVSHRLMLRAGMIKQASAGIYSWLPLGYKVLRRIEQIVHEEQIRAGHQPMLMPTIQSADLWRESGRYDALRGRDAAHHRPP